MTRYTTTVFDLIKSELINSGKSEFYTNNNIVFNNDEYVFIKKIMRFDEDVKKIVDKMFFQNEKLSTTDSDTHFKKIFVNRFLNRQIGRQTVEDFSSQVMYVYLLNEDYINSLYNDSEKYLKELNENNSKGNNTNQNDNRTLHTTLPQSQVNLNVEDTELAYGDTNTLTRNKDTSNNNNETISTNYNLDILIKIKPLLEEIFIEFDKNCFMQVF